MEFNQQLRLQIFERLALFLQNNNDLNLLNSLIEWKMFSRTHCWFRFQKI